MSKSDLVPLPSVELIRASEVPTLLDQVRPQWQARNLIDRVRRLLLVDPSSACQRLFNAAIHDLREKVVIAGVDIAAEAAKQNGLPPINKDTDVEDYPTAKLIDLAYKMGLLSRPEWRRVCRCYEIRRDLEHEDDEYEAGVEDCIYIFKTSIEVVLARDPIHLLRVTDVKQLIEQADAIAPDDSLLMDYEHAPATRQEEILKFLISIALNREQPDVVQQNAFLLITHLESRTHNPVKLRTGAQFQERIGRRGLDRRNARVAFAAGILPYLRNTARQTFFEQEIYAQMEKVGYRWTAYRHHGELLRSFQEVGGLLHCPPEVRRAILKWLALAYLGVPGGVTQFGNVRHVFYSNTAAHLVRDIISAARAVVGDELRELADDKHVKAAIADQHIARRYEALLDLLD